MPGFPVATAMLIRRQLIELHRLPQPLAGTFSPSLLLSLTVELLDTFAIAMAIGLALPTSIET